MHRPQSSIAFAAVVLFSLLATAGCQDVAVHSSGGFDEFGPPDGLTPGGSQDWNYLRQVIENGGIPHPDDVVPEGLYSEHDLPIDVGGCEGVMCTGARAAAGTFVDGNGPELLVQMGMSMGLSADLDRPVLNLALVADTSCSMSGEPIEATVAAMRRMLDGLLPEDRVALVEFGSSARVIRPSTPVGDGSELRDAIDSLDIDGSTDMESGYRLGVAQVRNEFLAAAENRVLIFTDAQPNVGAVSAGAFGGLAASAAGERIHTTVVGAGVSFGAELSRAMSELRGGNAFYIGLSDPGSIEQVFAPQNLVMSLVPLLFDLWVDTDMTWTAVYGVPGADPSSGALIEVKSAFASRRKGGIAFRLPMPAAPEQLGNLLLTYEDRAGNAWDDNFPVYWNGGTWGESANLSADGHGAYKMFALTEMALSVREAARRVLNGPVGSAAAPVEQALALLREAHQLLGREADDQSLEPEIELLEQLLLNIEQISPE